MWSSRRRSEASRRLLERREREDSSSRLLDEVPNLLTLELTIRERHCSSIAEVGHIRRIVVDNAPALFELPCADRGCANGGHDLTRQILAQLKLMAPRFDGEHVCRGQLGATSCERVLHYVAVATYRKA